MALPAAAPAQAPRQQPQTDAQRRRDLLFEALVGTLERLAQDRPLLLVLEDAHWIDPTSLQLLELVVGRIEGRAMLIAVTARPEFQPTWRGQPEAARIEVGPIGPGSAEALVRSLPGAADLPDATVRGIAVRADGVPLYIEELTKAVVDGAMLPGGVHAEGQGAAIPSSLHASLMARLDRIGPTREVARIAAALGREFTFALLCAVIPDRDPTSLRRDLERLVAADLLVPVASPAPPGSDAYAFRHALIQDAAYGTLLRSERRALHGRIAAAIAQSFPEVAATQPEIVAGHCTRAELWEPAVAHWLAAGKRAVRGWALAEAAQHFSEGIRAAGKLPPSPRRQRLELDLHLAVGPVMMGTYGYAAEASLEVYRRAEPLVHAMGNVSERLMAMLGLFNVHYGRAELAEALGVARAYLALAERHGVSLGRAHGLIAQTHAATGAFEEAAHAFQASLAVFAHTPEDVSVLGVFGSQHVISLALGGGVHFALGRPEQGQAALAEAVALARQLQHALSIALALVTELLTPIPGGLDPDLARAEAAVRFCVQHRLGNFQTWAEFACGAVVARRGDPRAGLGLMRAAVDAAETMSSRLFRPTQLATLASAHARLGAIDEALALLDQALAIATQAGEHRAEAALHRLRGELLLGAGRQAEADAALQQSLGVARAQRAAAEAARTETAIARLTRR